MYLKAIFSVLVFLILPASANDICKEWFEKSGIKTSDKECLSKCNLFEKDMSTFTCSNNCDKFCKPAKCSKDPYWKNLIKTGRPTNWTYNSEKTVDWTNAEKEEIENLLSLLPDELKTIPINGIYRMKKSIDFSNPATTSTEYKQIILYNNTFGHPSWSTKEVLYHEIGHIVFQSMERKFQKDYQNNLGWKEINSTYVTDRSSFISARAKDDIYEDSSENFKFFLLDPKKLKVVVPEAEKFFKNKFKSNFQLKEGCN